MFGRLGYQTYRATENNVDVLGKIVENISNVNSVGYKKRDASFVETLNGEIAKHESQDFSQGPLRRTGELYDLALDGPGFFEVELQNGRRVYTRAGRFRLSGEGELVTDEGHRVIPEIEPVGKGIEFTKVENNELGLNIKVTTPRLIIPSNLVPEILEDGTVNGINPETGEKTKIGKVSVVIFNNPQGLESLGRGYFSQTKSSGPVQDMPTGANAASKVKQGFLEFGNVNMLTEFMNLSQIKSLLAAQFKVLKTIDKIYEQVNYTVSRTV